jgi:N-acetylmuramoyl-L-alanine amidase
MNMTDKNGVPYIIDHIPKNTKKRRPGYKLDWQFITIHSTGNARSTARNERAWLVNPNNANEFVGWHIVVDEREAIEAIPLTENAWHTGDGVNGIGNRNTIGIEICESGNRAKTLLNAARVVAALLAEKKKDTNALRQHYDWNKRTACPSILRANSGQPWREFIASVNAYLKREEPPLRRLYVQGIQIGAFRTDDALAKAVTEAIGYKRFPIEIREVK